MNSSNKYKQSPVEAFGITGTDFVGLSIKAHQNETVLRVYEAYSKLTEGYTYDR